MTAEKRINVDYVSRVEGQGGIDLYVSRDGSLKDVKINIYEPPRFFEAFMVGRRYHEVAELVARICGICPVSHEITALRAVEDALGVEVSEATRNMRKLLAMSAYISSHILSIYFLTLPDYLGYGDLIEASKEHGDLLNRGLRLKKLGNDLTDLVGGRSVHPVTAVLGRFTNTISKEDAKHLRRRFAESKGDAMKTIETLKDLEYPRLDRKTEFLALRDDEGYAINEGILTSSMGISAPQRDYRKYIEERQVRHSTAKHSSVKGRDSFMVGPLARVSLNNDVLSDDSKDAARSLGFRASSLSPFMSPLARAVEVVHCIDECIELLDGLPYSESEKAVEVKAGDGFAITEAPRGINYHNYTLDRGGVVVKADIVPPTCQNYASMEADFWGFVPGLLDLPEKEIARNCEMLIRTYDPCVSCSVHAIRIHEIK